MDAEVVVVTGASAGLGRAITRRLARTGASLGLLAREPVRREAARRGAQGRGARAVAIPADVADAKPVERAAIALAAIRAR
ncbi:MAG: SDR family NAD(P)-dependent oxidoreductase [Gemmatimonadetes bacterium]|nr:SDR family NAD(P)-dependent oxidoreductase [Gemmatimonadota bacterium]